MEKKLRIHRGGHLQIGQKPAKSSNIRDIAIMSESNRTAIIAENRLNVVTGRIVGNRRVTNMPESASPMKTVERWFVKNLPGKTTSPFSVEITTIIARNDTGIIDCPVLIAVKTDRGELGCFA